MQWLLGDQAAWFTVPAILATLFFLIEIALGQIAGTAGADADLSFDAPDLSTDGPDATSQGRNADSAVSDVRFLSAQSIAAFAMTSGWTGLIAYRALDMSFGIALLIGVGAGIATAWAVVESLRRLTRIASSGNVALHDAVGLIGPVCVAVPPAGAGAGRVTLVVNNMQREFNAIQRGNLAVPSRTPVRVIDLDRAANAVVVEPAEA